jgi:N-methylhydantoinase A/oxoprolinase/acetone carboxylase beta subunit
VQTLNRALADLDVEDLRARVAGMADACQARLDSAGVAFEAVRESIELDMLYVGQSHTVRVEVPRDALERADIGAAFEAAYRAAYGRALGGIAVRILNLRYARLGVRPKFDLAVLAPKATAMPRRWARSACSTTASGTRRCAMRGSRCRWPRASKAPRSWSRRTPPCGSNPASTPRSMRTATCW